jgi:hypothetical protein
MTVQYQWRGPFTNDEANRLHAEAFETRLSDADEWNWERLVRAHSLGWVTARSADDLVGFVNVIWDGLVHAWVQDEMVAKAARGSGIGRGHAKPAARSCTSISRTICGPFTTRRAASRLRTQD